RRTSRVREQGSLRRQLIGNFLLAFLFRLQVLLPEAIDHPLQRLHLAALGHPAGAVSVAFLTAVHHDLRLDRDGLVETLEKTLVVLPLHAVVRAFAAPRSVALA